MRQLVRRFHRGDTIIEVMVAFGVFAALAMGTTTVMNRSVAMGQRSLEMTLVREQVDTQADLLRYARDNNLPAWQTITSGTMASDPGPVTFDTCPVSGTDLRSGSFIMAPALSGTQGVRVALVNNSASYTPAESYSLVRFDASTLRAYGLWVTPVAVESAASAPEAYDMYIRACWYSVGQSRPLTMSTIVRLYGT